jgi:hypothetical protein
VLVALIPVALNNLHAGRQACEHAARKAGGQ